MKRFAKILNKRYPQNFILKNPLPGSLIFLAFSFLFAIIYQPLKSHASQSFNYPVTMAIYCIASSLLIFILIKIIKITPFYSDKKEWTFVKEITSIFWVLAGMGITVYLMGFLMEKPDKRWNLDTFFDSFISAFLLGIIPFAFFTLSNYRHLLVTDIIKDFENNGDELPVAQDKEDIIQIRSKLKKEELGFYPHEFIYAESDGNYVAFYLADEHGTRKKIIRNSISNIEQQLADIPFFIRIHRAFIVNVKKIRSKKGNTLGYRLKLSGSDSEIPVSRQKVSPFDELLSRYK